MVIAIARAVVAVSTRAEHIKDPVVVVVVATDLTLSRVLAEGSNTSAGIGRSGLQVTRLAVEETRAVRVDSSASLSETSLAYARYTESIITIRVGRAGGTGDTTEVSSGLGLHSADRVDGVDAITLVSGGVVAFSRVGEVVVGALRLIGRESSITVDNGAGESTVTGLSSDDTGEGEKGRGSED